MNEDAEVEEAPRGDWRRRSPLDRSALGVAHAKYIIIRIAIEAIWLLGLISPSAWIFTRFKQRYHDGRYHTPPDATDILMMVWLGVATLLAVSSDHTYAWRLPIALFCGLLIVDLARSNVHLMVIRPAVDPDYRPFNKARSLILCCLAYATTTLSFAALYNGVFHCDFRDALDCWRSISLAIGIATTTGASGLSPKTTAGFLAVSAQAVMSVAFLGVIISTAISRQPPIQTLGS